MFSAFLACRHHWLYCLQHGNLHIVVSDSYNKFFCSKKIEIEPVTFIVWNRREIIVIVPGWLKDMNHTPINSETQKMDCYCIDSRGSNPEFLVPPPTTVHGLISSLILSPEGIIFVSGMVPTLFELVDFLLSRTSFTSALIVSRR